MAQSWQIYTPYRYIDFFFKLIKWTWLFIFEDFNTIIFNYQMLIHLWNLLNLGQNLYQNLLMIIMVDVTWKSLKKNSQNPHEWGPNRDFKNIFIRHTKFEKQKTKIISKGLLRIRFIFYPSKVYNYHLVKGFKKKIHI